jgi:hypothetical protein
MQEAVFSGCIPLVPNRLSYPEMYNLAFTYPNELTLIKKLETLMKSFDKTGTPPLHVEKALNKDIDYLLTAGKMAIPNMFDEIQKLG